MLWSLAKASCCHEKLARQDPISWMGKLMRTQGGEGRKKIRKGGVGEGGRKKEKEGARGRERVGKFYVRGETNRFVTYIKTYGAEREEGKEDWKQKKRGGTEWGVNESGVEWSGAERKGVKWGWSCVGEWEGGGEGRGTGSGKDHGPVG